MSTSSSKTSIERILEHLDLWVIWHSSSISSESSMSQTSNNLHPWKNGSNRDACPWRRGLCHASIVFRPSADPSIPFPMIHTPLRHMSLLSDHMPFPFSLSHALRSDRYAYSFLLLMISTSLTKHVPSPSMMFYYLPFLVVSSVSSTQTIWFMRSLPLGISRVDSLYLAPQFWTSRFSWLVVWANPISFLYDYLICSVAWPGGL